MECDGTDQEKDQLKMSILHDKGFQCKVFRSLGGGILQNCMCKNTKRFRFSAINSTEIVVDPIAL
jgi:hypothetical protein